MTIPRHTKINRALREKRAREEYGMYKAATLSRRGTAIASTPQSYLSHKTQGHLLSPELLWQSYYRSPYIRPCIDGIQRTIKNIPFMIEPRDGRENWNLSKGEQAKQKEISQAFGDPNKNKEGWNTFIGLVLTDLIIYDAPAIELVKGGGTGRLLEMVPLYGPSIKVIRNDKGLITRYLQQLGTDEPVKFEPEEMIYAPMYASTRSPYGISIIQTCIDQMTYLLLQADHHSRILDKDEIPDGIVMASGIAHDEWKKFIAEVKLNKGKNDKLHAIGTNTPQGKVDWVSFKRGSKEEQLLEIGMEAERIIVRNFGIDPTSAGLPTKYGTRGKAEIEAAATSSSLIEPICRHLEEHFNVNVVWRWPGGENFCFRFQLKDRKDVTKLTLAIDKQTRGGLRTINEGRVAIGKEPYENMPFADRPVFQVPGVGLILLDTGEVLGKTLTPTEVPSPPPSGQRRMSALTIEAHGKGHAKARELNDLIHNYTKELLQSFDNFGREASGIMNAGALEQGPIQFTPEQREMKATKLKKLRDRYWLYWKSILTLNAQHAAKFGTDRAMIKLRFSNLSETDRQEEITKLVNANHVFMKQAWRKYLDRLLWVLNRATGKGPGGLPDDIVFENVLAFERAQEAAMAASVASIEAYGHYLWAVENVIYAREAGAHGMKVYWHQTSHNPCEDCMSMGEQLHNPLQMAMFPGEGTRCDGRCHCFLEIMEEKI